MKKREREEAKKRWRQWQTHLPLWVEITYALPDRKFLNDLVDVLDPDDPQFADKYHQGLIALVASDVMLSRRLRSHLASELRRLYFPNAARDLFDRNQAEAWALQMLKHAEVERGATKTEAENILAKRLDMKVDTVRKKIQRAQKKLGQKGPKLSH